MLPITMEMMKIKHVLSQLPPSYENVILWAPYCLTIFGFLRISEFIVPMQLDYDDLTHFSLKDISVDNHSNTRLIKLRIKQSKTDPFRQCVDIYQGATDSPICHVSALMLYLTERGNQSGPLFITNDHTYLTRALFNRYSSDLTNVSTYLVYCIIFCIHYQCIGQSTI